MKTDKYYESQIKCDVLNSLRKHRVIDSRSIVASEYKLGSTGRRADLAVYNGSKLIGIEIKSKHDSLVRLRDQLDVYGACFDEVMLVSDERHISSALNISPLGVSVFEIDPFGCITLRREATTSRARAKLGCLQLLTVTELKKLTGVPLNVSMKKRALLAEADQVPDELIIGAATEAFIQAFSDTSLRFWRSVGRKKITPDELIALSRFAPERMMIREKKEQKALFWEMWRRQATAVLQGASS
ncbi:hypothetical protein BTE77_17230 [Ensifer adhaerens]|nr:hypothetical protein BTE77_17230 [Ensifer adhaerens]